MHNITRPVFLIDTVVLPPRISATTPSIEYSQRELLKAPDKMIVDYIFMHQKGYYMSSGIQVRGDVAVKIMDKNREQWTINPIPIESYNNFCRGRDETNVFYQLATKEIAASGEWIPPAGKYMMIVQDIAGVTPPVYLQFNTGTLAAPVWVGALQPNGVVECDGINVRLFNASANPETVLFRRIDSYGEGQWWLKFPFKLQRSHSLGLFFQSYMDSSTKFEITFQACGVESKKIFFLRQPVELGPGARQIFNGLEMDSMLQEPLEIKSMSYGRIDHNYAFDPRYVGLQIKPSMGSSWSEEPIPLIAYSNLYGDFVSAFHKPVSDIVLEQNDFLTFECHNYSEEQRIIILVISGYTI